MSKKTCFFAKFPKPLSRLLVVLIKPRNFNAAENTVKTVTNFQFFKSTILKNVKNLHSINSNIWISRFLDIDHGYPSIGGSFTDLKSCSIFRYQFLSMIFSERPATLLSLNATTVFHNTESDLKSSESLILTSASPTTLFSITSVL